ncbi:MAG: hypothetical protein RLZZ501_1569 [Pseudomonadota bacterium]
MASLSEDEQNALTSLLSSLSLQLLVKKGLLTKEEILDGLAGARTAAAMVGDTRIAAVIPHAEQLVASI